MKAKAYLLQIQRISRVLENKANEASYWRNLAQKSTTQLGKERVQSSLMGSITEAAICEYVDIENEIRTRIREMIDTRQEVIETLEELAFNQSDSLMDEYNILYLLYVGKEGKYLNFDEVADELHLSRRTVVRKHGTGLLKIQRLLDERDGNGKGNNHTKDRRE